VAPTRSIDAQGQIVALPLLLSVAIIVAGNPDAVAARLSAEWFVLGFPFHSFFCQFRSL